MTDVKTERTGGKAQHEKRLYDPTVETRKDFV